MVSWSQRDRRGVVALGMSVVTQSPSRTKRETKRDYKGDETIERNQMRDNRVEMERLFEKIK